MHSSFESHRDHLHTQNPRQKGMQNMMGNMRMCMIFCSLTSAGAFLPLHVSRLSLSSSSSSSSCMPMLPDRMRSSRRHTATMLFGDLQVLFFSHTHALFIALSFSRALSLTLAHARALSLLFGSLMQDDAQFLPAEELQAMLRRDIDRRYTELIALGWLGRAWLAGNRALCMYVCHSTYLCMHVLCNK